jgi:hypothetical protein
MSRAQLPLAAALLLGGCVRTYTVTALPDPNHYVVVQSAAGGMKVYDCLSAPLGEYDPTCVRVDFRARPKRAEDAPAPARSEEDEE